MRLLITTLLTALTFSSANATISDGLPSNIRDALDAAYASKNQFVIESVIKNAKKTSPAQADKVDSYFANQKAEEQKTAEAKLKKSPFSGNIDTSLDVANGNTKRQAASLSAKLKYVKDDMENTTKFTARTSKEDRVRTNEEYQINNQTNYNFTDSDYLFFEAEYVNDRFSGFEYRISELLGYGRKIIKSDDLNISTEISAGGRQSSLTDGSSENSLLGKLTAKGDWKITNTITFEQEFSSSFGSDAVISTSDSALKTKLMEALYLKINYNLQHIDNVPANKKQLDSLMSVGVGYEF